MISIIMPLFNGSNFLDDSIPSIMNQTYEKWELLIGTNGLDATAVNAIEKKVSAFKDSRIKVLPFGFKGKVKTLNKLAGYSKNNIICTIDVDDIWLPTKLEKQMLVIDKYDVIGTDIEYCGDKAGSPQLFLGKLNPLTFSWQNPIISSTVMMKKKDAVWNEVWESLEDYNLWIHLLNKGKIFYNVPEVLALHRIHAKSYFNNKNKAISDKFVAEKIKPLTLEEQMYLTDIIDGKKWVV